MKTKTLDETIQESFNYHEGTCDSCGVISWVSRWNTRGFEYLCQSCITTIAGARSEIRKERAVLEKAGKLETD